MLFNLGCISVSASIIKDILLHLCFLPLGLCYSAFLTNLSTRSTNSIGRSACTQCPASSVSSSILGKNSLQTGILRRLI